MSRWTTVDSLWELGTAPDQITQSAATVTGIKRDVARLGVSWLPRNSRGQTAWCR